MPRYIDADHLDELITRLNNEGRGITRNEYKMIDSILFEFPTADVVERKKGKWINDKGLYRCSSCNQVWAEWWVTSKPIERMKKECPYCPLCGSYNGEATEDDMREESKDAEIH